MFVLLEFDRQQKCSERKKKNPCMFVNVARIAILNHCCFLACPDFYRYVHILFRNCYKQQPLPYNDIVISTTKIFFLYLLQIDAAYLQKMFILHNMLHFQNFFVQPP